MASESKQSESSPQSPESKPRRKKWKIILVCLGVMLLLPVVLWIAFDMTMTRRINAQFEKYRAAGEPADFKDFWSPEVPDEQNAVIPIRRATESLNVSDEEHKVISDGVPFAFVRDNQKFVESLLSKNAAAFESLDQSRSCSKFSLGLKPTDFDSMLPNLGAYRLISKFAGLRAIDFTVKGDFAAAIECIEDMQRIAACVSESNSMIIFMVQVAIESRSIQTLEEILPHISKPSSQVELGRINAMFDRLKTGFLAESQLVESGKKAFYFERFMARIELDVILSPRWIGPAKAYGFPDEYLQLHGKVFFIPVIKRQMLENVLIVDSYVTAVASENYPAGMAVVRPTPNDFISQRCDRLAGLWGAGSYCLPDLKRCCQLFFRCLAARRMAAIAIAMKQYEIDNGLRPAALGDLVPKYLAAIPTDPFSAVGEPIKLGAWGGRRLLYSIGENMVDEKGQYAASASDRPETDSYDIPFFLDGDRPRPPMESSISATTTTSAPASAPNSVGQNRRK